MWNKNLDVLRIHLDSVLISVCKTAGKAATPEPAEGAHPILPDSILLPGISGVSLGNFIWKAIQSWVVNSLNPVGKHHRE